MMLENLMEEKQLDFNQPLLSVRRSSSMLPSESEKKAKPDDSLPKIPPLPIYKSELKSGPVRNPGTVPFQWEFTPGRPKDETRFQQRNLERPPIPPKFPPGRTLNIKQEELSRNRQINRPVLSNSQHVSSLNKNVMKHESPKATVEDSRSSGSEYDEHDDDDDDYVDAVDTLSRSESFFLNCSVSGVSGLNGLDMEPSGVFSSDPQTRDFMMGRFLPAAKAMASKTPPHTVRKQPVAQEQPRSVKKPVPKETQCTVQHKPNILPYLQYWQEERCEESEEEEECGKPESTARGACGLLPLFCLKSSFGLLNPVPGVRMQAQKAVSVRRMRSSYPLSGSYSDNEHEHANGAKYEQRSISRYQKMEMNEDKIKARCGPNQIAFETKPVQRAAVKGNELCTPIVHEGKEKVENFGVWSTNSQTKGSKNFGELLAIEDNGWVSGSESPVVEKTLYIDAVHIVKSSDTTKLTDYGGDRSNEHENPTFDGTVKDDKAFDSCFGSSPGRLINDSQINNHRNEGSRNLEMAGNKGVHLEKEVPKKPWIREQTHEQNWAIVPLAISAVTENSEKIDFEIKARKWSSASESCNGSHRQRPVPPPLPQAPSDSWLKRTLPAVSAKNSFAWSSPSTDNYSTAQALKHNSSADPKWETMVKTSNVQQGHLRFSAEQLDPIPEA